MIKYLTTVISLSVLFYYNYELRKGTSIIVFAEKDSITIASDSKSQNYKNDFSAYEFNSGNDKLLRIGNKIICLSGVSEIKELNVKNVLPKYVKTQSQILEDANRLTDGLIFEYKNVAKKLTIKEINGLSKIQVHTRILIVGYEKKIPIVSEVIVGLSPNIKSGSGVRYIEPTFRMGGVFRIGITDRIENKIKGGFKFSNNRLKDLEYLIKLQAKYNAKVDSNINYVIIRPNNTFTFGNL